MRHSAVRFLLVACSLLLGGGGAGAQIATPPPLPAGQLAHDVRQFARYDRSAIGVFDISVQATVFESERFAAAAMGELHGQLLRKSELTELRVIEAPPLGEDADAYLSQRPTGATFAVLAVRHVRRVDLWTSTSFEGDAWPTLSNLGTSWFRGYPPGLLDNAPGPPPLPELESLPAGFYEVRTGSG